MMQPVFGVTLLALFAIATAQLSKRRPEPGRTRWRRTSMVLAALALALALYDMGRGLGH